MGMKRSAGKFVAWLGTLVLSIGLYLVFPSFFDGIHRRANDLFFSQVRLTEAPRSITIVDIDDASLAHVGQWPWSRNRLAALINVLHQNGAKIIGLDMVFPEPDRTSPAYLNQTLDLNLSHPQDYDDLLGKSLAQTPTVGGYIFAMNTHAPAKLFPHTTATIVERGIGKTQTVPEASGLIPNITPIRTHLTSTGFLNVLPDATGILRSAPLLMRYRDRIFPSLDLELVRLALNQSDIHITRNSAGLESIQVGSLSLPVDAKGSLSIHFAQQGFSRISAHKLLANPAASVDLKGHIVLIGSSAAALQDFRATPTSAAMPGVDIHATILANILSQNTLMHPAWIAGLNLLIFVAFFTIAYWLLLGLSGFALMVMTLLGFVGLWFGVRWVIDVQHLVIDTLLPFWGWGLAAGVALVMHYVSEKKERKATYKALEKKVSPRIAKHLTQKNLTGAQEREVTILFSDIRHFTALSEQIDSPKTLLELLNRYTEPMSQIIAHHHGTIDKYIGDAIMAYWNAPEPLTNHADHALQSALKQHEYLQQLNPMLKREFGHTLSIGIGIHTGTAIMGEVGSRERSDYTLIGDSVNLAARLQELTKTYHTPIIISQATKDQLQQTYHLTKLDTVAVRGKDERITLYGVRGDST